MGDKSCWLWGMRFVFFFAVAVSAPTFHNFLLFPCFFCVWKKARWNSFTLTPFQEGGKTHSPPLLLGARFGGWDNKPSHRRPFFFRCIMTFLKDSCWGNENKILQGRKTCIISHAKTYSTLLEWILEYSRKIYHGSDYFNKIYRLPNKTSHFSYFLKYSTSTSTSTSTMLKNHNKRKLNEITKPRVNKVRTSQSILIFHFPRLSWVSNFFFSFQGTFFSRFPPHILVSIFFALLQGTQLDLNFLMLSPRFFCAPQLPMNGEPLGPTWPGLAQPSFPFHQSQPELPMAMQIISTPSKDANEHPR